MMLGSPCSPCCGCSPASVQTIYERLRGMSCSIELDHELQWQQAATHAVDIASDGQTGAQFSRFNPIRVGKVASECFDGTTVPQFGIFLGVFQALPQAEIRGVEVYFVGTNTLAITNQGNTLGHTCAVGGNLYALKQTPNWAVNPVEWALVGSAADRSCGIQLQQVQECPCTSYKEAITPDGVIALALDTARSFRSGTEALVVFTHATSDYTIDVTIAIGVYGAVQYPGTQCRISPDVQVTSHFRQTGGIVSNLPTATQTPTYTPAQEAALLPWVNLPGCKAWIAAPYYTASFASNTPLGGAVAAWFAADDYLPWQGVGIYAETYHFLDPILQSILAHDIGEQVSFTVSNFLNIGSAFRWRDYETPASGAPAEIAWYTGLTFGKSLFLPVASDPSAYDACFWRFPQQLSTSTTAYTSGSPGTISSATIVLT